MSRFTHLDAEGEHSIEFDYSTSGRTLTVGDKTYPCDGQSVWIAGRRTPFWVQQQNDTISVWLDGEVFTFNSPDPRRRGSQSGGAELSSGAVKAQMPGKILSVAVKLGDTVTEGQNLLVMESMKMELALDAPCDGTVESLPISVGQMVAQGDLLVALQNVEDEKA